MKQFSVKNLSKSIVLFLIFSLFASCNKEEEEEKLVACTSFGDAAVNHCSFKLDDQDGAAHKVGRSEFNIKVTPVHGGIDPAGLKLTLEPMMDMVTKIHSTPVQSITDMGGGTYKCVVYYLMASSMNNMKMGDWTLNAKVNSESVLQQAITVTGMSSSISLSGIADLIKVDNLSASRPYFLFIEEKSSSSMKLDSIKIYAATREDMMTHPALYTGLALKNEAGTAWSVNTIVLEVSKDQTIWKALTEDSAKKGTFSISGLDFMASGMSMTLYFRLKVNDEAKTLDGKSTGSSIASLSIML